MLNQCIKLCSLLNGRVWVLTWLEMSFHGSPDIFSKAKQSTSISKAVFIWAEKNQGFNSSCISVLLFQNLLCIVILNLTTPNNKKKWYRERALQVHILSAWPHRVDAHKNNQYPTISKDVRTKVVSKSILINWIIPQVIKSEVTWRWN